MAVNYSRARWLLGSGLVPLSMLAASPAWADCLPNASGTIVNCNANDPDGFVAGDGVTINVTPGGTVNGPLTVGAAGRINNEGIVGNPGPSAITAGGGSTVVNTRIATVNGSLGFGSTGTGVLNTFDNRGQFNGSVTSAGALTLSNDFTGIEVGQIIGNISSTGATTITNSGAAALIQGTITLGDGNDSIANSGIVQGDIAFGTGTTQLTNAAGGQITGNISAGGNSTITNAGSFTGNITLGGGDDVITNTGAITGNINMGAGTNTIGFGSTAALPTGTLTADAAGTSTINLFGSGADTLNIAVTNFDVLNKDGTGSWELTQAISLSDRININAGTLITSDADWLGGNRIVNAANLNFSNLTDGTFAGVIEGTGAVTVGGGGTAVTTLSGANTYTGTTTVTGGTLRLSGGSALVDSGSVVVTAPGVLDVASAETIGTLGGTGSVTLSGGALSVNSGNFLGVISGANGLTKVGTGSLTLAGANTFAGPLTVSNGTVVLTGGAAVADTTAVVVNAAAGPPATSGTLQVSAAETIGSLAGNGGSVVLGAGLTTGGDNSSTGYAGVISGTGSLTKAGTGVFTLTGANTYSGGTVINAGTLAGAVGPLQGAMLVNAGGTLRFDQTADASFAGALSGAGVVQKAGAGVLTLTGTNTGHTGTLDITGGSVSIGSAANIGTGVISLTGTTLTTTGALTLANAITLNAPGGTLNTGAATTLSGVISGAGALTKTGTATLTLTGANSYSGGTTIAAGTLAGDTTSLQGPITNNAALVFDQAGAGTYAGAISGTGSVTKQGAGALTLTGSSSYSGATSVAAGTLITGTNGIGDSSAVTVATGATLQLAANETIGSLAGAGALDTAGFTLTTGGNNGSTTFSGATTGTGLTKVGTGTFTLTGTGTLSGALTANGGGLTIGTGGVYTAGSVAATAGTLAVAGSLTGPATAASGATLDIVSGGTLIGTVAANAGSTVRVNGTVTGDVTVAGSLTTPATTGGTLTGAGTINGTLVSSGSLRPGNSPGILTVNGAFTQTATGTLNAELTPVATAGTGYDQVRVIGTPGTATLAGTLALAPATGLYTAGATYDVVRASGGITGDFTSISGNVLSPFLSFADTGVVTLTGTEQVYRLTVTRVSYATGLGAGATPNQIAVANGLQGGVAGATGDLATVVTAVDNMTADQAASFFDQASPEFYAAFSTALIDQSTLYLSQIDRRIEDRGGDAPFALWINFYGQWGKGSSGDTLFGTDRDLWGIVGGADYSQGDFVVGAALGYSSADLDYRLGNAEGGSDSWQIAAYAAYTGAGFDFRAKVGYSDGSFDATRSIVAGTIAREASADFSGNLFMLSVEGGYDLGNDDWNIRPFVGVEVLSGKVGSFTESGSGSIALAVESIQADSTRLQLGVDISKEAGQFTPYARLAYGYEVAGGSREVSGAFTGAPASRFTVNGREPGESSFDLDAGAKFAISDKASAFVGYQGRYRSDISSHGGNVGIRFSF
jgi:outer membrane autotransporter protein